MPLNEQMTKGNGHLTKQITRFLRRVGCRSEITLCDLQRVVDSPEAMIEAEKRGYCRIKRLKYDLLLITVTADGWSFLRGRRISTQTKNSSKP